MSTSTTTTRRSEWWIPTLLILLSLVPAIAGTSRLAQLAGGARVTPDNARFFAHPIPVVLHILSVIPYTFVGAFQFHPGFRRRNRPWHRIAGRALGVCGLVAALSGLWMAHFYSWPKGDGYGVYVERLVFGTAMVASIILGIDAARRRKLKAHGDWMIRAYAIGLGAGTQVLTHLPYFILLGKPGESARTVLMGAGWVINVAVAEWIIRRPPARARADCRTISAWYGDRSDVTWSWMADDDHRARSSATNLSRFVQASALLARHSPSTRCDSPWRAHGASAWRRNT